MKHKKQILLTVTILLAMAALFFESSVWAKPKIALNRSSLSITAEESRKLKLTGISSKNQSKVSWKSSAPGIASVTKNGKVKAKKAGTATITANYKEKNYRCKVQVASVKAEGTDIQTALDPKKDSVSSADTAGNEIYDTQAVTPGTSSYRIFLIDNVYHSKNNGDIHYHVYFPDSYDGKSDYALFITLPGYQGLYFQGVAENIRTEDFAFEAQKYRSKMIILAPQLNDWGQTSADQTIALANISWNSTVSTHRRCILKVIPEAGRHCHWYLAKSRSCLRQLSCAVRNGMVLMNRWSEQRHLCIL